LFSCVDQKQNSEDRGGRARWGAPESVENDDDEAVNSRTGPGGAPGGDVPRAVIAAAVEVQLGAGEEESTREEVDGQRVDCEDTDEEKRPGKQPRTAAVARRLRHQLRFRSEEGRGGPLLVKPRRPH
jgi:hypothetical protein